MTDAGNGILTYRYFLFNYVQYFGIGIMLLIR